MVVILETWRIFRGSLGTRSIVCQGISTSVSPKQTIGMVSQPLRIGISKDKDIQLWWLAGSVKGQITAMHTGPCHLARTSNEMHAYKISM